MPSSSAACPLSPPLYIRLHHHRLLPRSSHRIPFTVRSKTLRIQNPQISSQRMADQPVTRKLYDSAPSTRQTVRFLTAATIGLSLLVMSGLTLTGTVIALVLATPLLVIFSPVLVPAVIAMVMLAAGFVFSGGCGVAAATALSWVYRYVTGKQPIGADKIDYARTRIAEKAKEYGHYVQQKTQEATGTTQ